MKTDTYPHIRIRMVRIRSEPLAFSARYFLHKRHGCYTAESQPAFHTERDFADEPAFDIFTGTEETEKQTEWCKERNIKATPTGVINGKQLDSIYSVEVLLYF